MEHYRGYNITPDATGFSISKNGKTIETGIASVNLAYDAVDCENETHRYRATDKWGGSIRYATDPKGK